MAAAGDMTYILNADESRMVAGLKRAEEAARRSAGNMKAAFSGGGGGGLSQASYAAQDFASVMMQGGERNLSRAIGSVTNNISMMGASLGPWGLAISTGIALATQFGVAMWESSQKTKDADGALQEYMKTSDQMAQKARRGAEFANELDQLRENGTGKQVKDAADNVKKQMDGIQAEIDQRTKRMNALVIDRKAAGKNFSDDDKKVLKEEKDKLAELDDQMNRMRNRHKALAELMPEAEQRDKEKKTAKEVAEFKKQEQEKQFQRDKQAAAEDMQRFKERIDAIRQLEESTRTPQEKFNEERTRLMGMLRGGEISAELAGRGLAMAARQLPKIQNTQGAEVFGSSGAVSAIVRAEANANKQAETLDLMRQFLEEAKKQTDVLQDVKDNTADNQVVEIGG